MSIVKYRRAAPRVDREMPPTTFKMLGRALLAFGRLKILVAPKTVHRPETEHAPIADDIARGRYIAEVSGCHGCHGPGLSGGPVAGPPGLPPAANLTPTGIGSWQESDFVRAMRTGRRPDATAIDPFMPWQGFAAMTDDELHALWLYLRSVPPKPSGQKLDAAQHPRRARIRSGLACLPMPAAPAVAFSAWPFVVLVISVAAVVVGISLLRLHAFLALLLAALLAGVLASSLPADPRAPEKGQLVRAVELTATGFGNTAGGIAIVIGMATIIGMALMESGAADKVVRRFLAVSGTAPAGVSLAIVLSTYVLSIPIFFDSMFMLMVPIAVAMALRTGRDFTLYVCAICAGGVVTHALTIPHPGPIYMADNLKIDVGLSLWVGIAAGIVPMLAGWLVCQWLNRRQPIALRATASLPLDDARAMMAKPESELPGFVASLLPIVVPIALISLASVFEVVRQTYAKDAGSWAAGAMGLVGGPSSFQRIKSFVDFIGNKNVALMVGALLALSLLKRHRKLSLARISELTGPPLETAGVIILITSAGGAFGFMLAQAGVGDALAAWAKSQQGINLVLLGYLVSTVFRIAQGSATVAMQTTSAMFITLLPNLPCHPLYLFLAIGFGATGFSGMNDSGFWVVSRLSGFTERETLRTWTVLLTAISVVGLLMTLVMSTVLPLRG